MFQFPSNGKVYSELIEAGYDLSAEYTSFNSLQTGKCIQSLQAQSRRSVKVESFNSLQTGKCIQSWKIANERLQELTFQFPSNGKVYSENFVLQQRAFGASFNSLQTGKCIQSRTPENRFHTRMTY